MDKFQAEVRSNFRTEMFAFGLYTILGNQYKNFKPNFGDHLKEAGKQEHMHGKIFRQFYKEQYKQTLFLKIILELRCYLSDILMK